MTRSEKIAAAVGKTHLSAGWFRSACVDVVDRVIRDRVRELWCKDGRRVQMGYSEDGVTASFYGPIVIADDIQEGELFECYVSDTEAEAWESALLWLSERKD